MPARNKFSLKGPARDSYLELVTAFPLASIKSHDQLHEAQKVSGKKPFSRQVIHKLAGYFNVDASVLANNF